VIKTFLLLKIYHFSFCLYFNILLQYAVAKYNLFATVFYIKKAVVLTTAFNQN